MCTGCTLPILCNVRKKVSLTSLFGIFISIVCLVIRKRASLSFFLWNSFTTEILRILHPCNLVGYLKEKTISGSWLSGWIHEIIFCHPCRRQTNLCQTFLEDILPDFSGLLFSSNGGAPYFFMIKFKMEGDMKTEARWKAFLRIQC